MIDINRIRAAPRLIDPVFLDTPLVRQDSLDRLAGCVVLCKVETLNPIRSFKGRGASLFVATSLRPGEPVTCASAGNFGQGLARAATARGHACTVFAATTANPLKVAAMRGFGAEVILAGEDFDAAKAAARDHAQRHGLRFVEDGAEPAIAEGAGTIGLELAAADAALDAVFVPLGNGALLAGIGAVLRRVSAHTRIVAVVAEGAPAMQLSLAAGQAVETGRADTIADGIAVRVPVPESLPMLAGRHDAVVAVSDTQILAAMRIAHEHLGLVVEPAGAAGLAAILAQPSAAGRVATVLCGGNVSAALRATLCA